VTNWPAGGLGGAGGRGRGVRRGGRFRGVGGTLASASAGRGFSSVGGLLRGGGKLLGRAAMPLALGMGALDVAEGAAKGDAKQIGGGVGGVGGALAGAAAGAALGSVVPVIGTAFGGVVGSVIGGLGGDWLGRKVGGLFDDDEEDQAPAKKIVRQERYDAMGRPVHQSVAEDGGVGGPGPSVGPETALAAVPPVVIQAQTDGAASRPNQTFTFNVYGQEGMSAREIAEEVKRILRWNGREALFDGA